MKRNKGKYLQMRMLNANDRYRADNGCNNVIPIKVSVMSISFG